MKVKILVRPMLQKHPSKKYSAKTWSILFESKAGALSFINIGEIKLYPKITHTSLTRMSGLRKWNKRRSEHHQAHVTQQLTININLLEQSTTREAISKPPRVWLLQRKHSIACPSWRISTFSSTYRGPPWILAPWTWFLSFDRDWRFLSFDWDWSSEGHVNIPWLISSQMKSFVKETTMLLLFAWSCLGSWSVLVQPTTPLHS
jgi:hypothetical protein